MYKHMGGGPEGEKQVPENIEKKQSLDAIDVQIEDFAKKIGNKEITIDNIEEDLKKIDQTLENTTDEELKLMVNGLKGEIHNLRGPWSLVASSLTDYDSKKFDEYFNYYEKAVKADELEGAINNGIGVKNDHILEYKIGEPTASSKSLNNNNDLQGGLYIKEKIGNTTQRKIVSNDLSINLQTSSDDIKAFLEQFALTPKTNEAFIKEFKSINVADLFANKDNSYQKFMTNISTLRDSKVVNDQEFGEFKGKIKEYCAKQGVTNIPDGFSVGYDNNSISVIGGDKKILANIRSLSGKEIPGENIDSPERNVINRLLSDYDDVLRSLDNTTYKNHLKGENTVKIKDKNDNEVEENIYKVGDPRNAIWDYNEVVKSINKNKEELKKFPEEIKNIQEGIKPVKEYLHKVMEANTEIFGDKNDNLPIEYKHLEEIK